MMLYNDVQKDHKQLGIQMIWNLCCYYQDIYDWISPFSKPSGSWFILTLQSIGGEMSMVCPVNCLIIFHCFEALNAAFEVQFFFMATFSYPITNTDSMQDHAAQIS